MTEASGDPTGSSGLRSIPTEYAGVTFRSRLEATWAYNLDAWGIRWSYEPEGVILPSGARYLPDFWLPEIRTWLEVKGPGVGGLEKTEEFAQACTDSDGFITNPVIVGQSPSRGFAEFYGYHGVWLLVRCRSCQGMQFMEIMGGWKCWYLNCEATSEDAFYKVAWEPLSCNSGWLVEKCPWRQMQWQPNGSGR